VKGMTNEEFQKLVLEKLVSLEQGQKALEQGQKALEQRQKALEQGQKALEQSQKSLEQGQKAIEERMATKDDIARLEAKMDKGFADVIAMIDVTQKEVANVRRDLRVIEAVTAKNWNEILELKQAK